ncbi:MAG TPA: hypothetical protein VN577_07655 [Terriglobales bacterium]|nr:hypothetical protein [Terriglobales bacterium]
MRFIETTRMWPTLLLACLFVAGSLAIAQDSIVISGGAGMVGTTSSGSKFVQPILAPVAVVPIGERVLIESRGDIREFLFWPANGSYSHQFFGSLEYLQVSVIANSHLTLTAGKFLTPFGVYNERLTPIWIRNFQDAPIIFPIGTRTTGSSNGAMIRGNVVARRDWQVDYAGYFSASSNVEQFKAGRSAGLRTSLFLPKPGLEIGGSYERYLQATLTGDTVTPGALDENDTNIFGAHLWWHPPQSAFHFKSEFAHSPSGHGYWIETAYRFGKPASTAYFSGVEPLFRMQQFIRRDQRVGDSLPREGAQQADFGVNYYITPTLRVNGSYSRQFTPLGDRNIWNVAITYRFLVPIPLGSKK